jgi:hypothetical protein
LALQVHVFSQAQALWLWGESKAVENTRAYITKNQSMMTVCVFDKLMMG